MHIKQIKENVVQLSRTVLFAGLAASILVFSSCGRAQEVDQTQANPLDDIPVEQITMARFLGISSPVEGIHLETTDPELIRELYEQFRSLAPNNPHIVSMWGDFTTLHFLDADESILSEISINGDASTIVVRGSRDNTDDFLMTESPEAALFVFNFFREHDPEMLYKLREIDDRGVRMLHLKRYPFEELEERDESGNAK